MRFTSAWKTCFSDFSRSSLICAAFSPSSWIASSSLKVHTHNEGQVTTVHRMNAKHNLSSSHLTTEHITNFAFVFIRTLNLNKLWFSQPSLMRMTRVTSQGAGGRDLTCRYSKCHPPLHHLIICPGSISAFSEVLLHGAIDIHLVICSNGSWKIQSLLLSIRSKRLGTSTATCRKI